MNKLTAEKCREQFEAWWQENQHNGNPPRFGWDHYRDGDTYSDDEFQTLWEAWQASRQALEIALPVLERQGGWISVSDKLPTDCEPVTVADHGTDIYPAIYSDGKFYEYGDSFAPCLISNPNHWQPMPLAPQPQPSTTPQIDNDGWIEWNGGECPVGEYQAVEVRFRDGDIALMDYWADLLTWKDRGYQSDIIAYRIIPERATNQNGDIEHV